MCSVSLFIRHSYMDTCQTAASFWGTQLVASSLPWLVLAPLTNGLLYSQLLLSQALAAAACAANNAVRCQQAEAYCPGAAVQFADSAAILTQLASPFIPAIIALEPLPACGAVLSFAQITAGYFGVLAIRWRRELASRQHFAAGRGLQQAARQLGELRTSAWPPALSTYLAAAVTWQGLLLAYWGVPASEAAAAAAPTG